MPCYNEAKRLDPDAFITELDRDENLSFLFVNDGSTDGTQVILETMQAKKPAQIELLNLAKNCGKAESVRRGMVASLAGTFDNVGYWDADLATPLDVIGDLCRLFDTADLDLVIGSRVPLLGRNIERRAIRHYLGRIFATFASLLLGIVVYDTQCGAKIFRRTDWLRQVFGKPFKSTWIFDIEILARIPIVMEVAPQTASARWREFPLDKWSDVKDSKVSLVSFFRCGLEFGRLLFYLRMLGRRHYKEYLLRE